MQELLHNQFLLTAIIAWAIAQFAKFLYALVTMKRLDFSLFVGSGGMPSSHSALVTGLATAVGRGLGLNSPLFAVTCVLAAVVMYDAAGVRRAVSIQARILNVMIDEFFEGKNITEKRLRELVGHTPFQVLVGAAIGIIVGIVMY